MQKETINHGNVLFYVSKNDQFAIKLADAKTARKVKQYLVNNGFEKKHLLISKDNPNTIFLETVGHMSTDGGYKNTVKICSEKCQEAFVQFFNLKLTASKTPQNNEYTQRISIRDTHNMRSGGNILIFDEKLLTPNTSIQVILNRELLNGMLLPRTGLSITNLKQEKNKNLNNNKPENEERPSFLQRIFPSCFQDTRTQHER